MKQTGTDPMLAFVDTAPQISRPRLRLRWQGTQGAHSPPMVHRACTLRAASLSICSLLLEPA